jgi:predicted amidohydrolase
MNRSPESARERSSPRPRRKTTAAGRACKIGYQQFAPVLGDAGATRAKLEGLAPAWAGLRLLVLPELSNSGYRFRTKKEARAAAEPLSDSPFLRFLETQCRRHRLHIVSGLNERAGARIYNTSVVVGPEGLIGRYRKVHLFADEKDYFTPGNLGFPVFSVGKWKIGMLICFDWIFPEAWRALALAGADLIAHPSNLVLPGLCQRAIPVHAVTNRVYIVTANRTGTERDLAFTGRSLIADPAGEVVVSASARGEELGVAVVDLSRARRKRVTRRNDVLGDRRPETYTILVARITRPAGRLRRRRVRHAKRGSSPRVR